MKGQYRCRERFCYYEVEPWTIPNTTLTWMRTTGQHSRGVGAIGERLRFGAIEDRGADCAVELASIHLGLQVQWTIAHPGTHVA